MEKARERGAMNKIGKAMYKKDIKKKEVQTKTEPMPSGTAFIQHSIK